tara:strand:+ start:3422 stop:4162 length:741 start_codon:yes stop_codon:yes gene_type:complete
MNNNTMSKWQKVKTVGDFLDFIEDPNIDYVDFTNSFANNTEQSFWIAAHVTNTPNYKQLLKYKPEISATELSSTTMTASELDYHKSHNFGNGYDRYKPDSNLVKIADALGFENASIWINNQSPGTVMGRHVDCITCFMHENQEELRSQMFDKERRQPANSKNIWRCFVALEDWQPGQIVNFEPNFWTNWTKGDVLFFDWRNTAHSTANAGVKDRPFLKITGTMKDDQFVLDARQDKNKIKVIDLND